MVDILLAFVRSIREGNCVFHFVCLRQMLPYKFAYDRINYAWYMTIYYCEMTVLERTHPEAYQRLMSGDFAVQRSPANAFAQVAIDQAIEQTINRDSKVKGGILGYSLRPGAVHRWIITAHEKAAVSRACKTAAGIDTLVSGKRDGRSICCKSKRKGCSVFCQYYCRGKIHLSHQKFFLTSRQESLPLRRCRAIA